MSQTVLAEKLGVNNPNISRWVNGHDFPGEGLLPKICEALGVTEKYFTQGDSVPPPTVKSLIEALEAQRLELEALKALLPGDIATLWPKLEPGEQSFVIKTIEGMAAAHGPKPGKKEGTKNG